MREVFVLPSLVEGLSLALLEAMASGTACIATDAGADGRIGGGAGIVLSTQGVATQLRTLLPVLRDQPVLTGNSVDGHGSGRLRYTLSRNIDAIEELYGTLLATRRWQPDVSGSPTSLSRRQHGFDQAERSPACSRRRRPAMVVPPGELTMS